MKPRILVANTGRSASRFACDLLNEVGIPANHESMHVAPGARTARPNDRSDAEVEVGWPSSYHLDEFDAIYLVLRDPLKTAYSFASRPGTDAGNPWGDMLAEKSGMPKQFMQSTVKARKRRAVWHMDFIYKSVLSHPNFKRYALAESAGTMALLATSVAGSLERKEPERVWQPAQEAWIKLGFVGQTRTDKPWDLDEYHPHDAITLRFWLRYFGYE